MELLNKKYKLKSLSKPKKNKISPNIKVIPPKRIRKNLNTQNPNTLELRSENESVMSKLSEINRSKEI
jgi:hypothetical protein